MLRWTFPKCQLHRQYFVQSPFPIMASPRGMVQLSERKYDDDFGPPVRTRMGQAITMTNFPSPRLPFRAEDATLQALLNGFLREIDSGQIIQTEDVPIIDIALHHCKALLRVEVEYVSRTGPHEFGKLYLRFDGAPLWQDATAVQIISLITQECFARHTVSDDQKLPDFMRAVFDSNAQINTVMRRHQPQDVIETFLQAEQSLAFGHWLHPTPKSRDGMTNWHLSTYAPEFRGAFQLVFFAAHKSITRTGTAAASFDEMLRDLPGLPHNMGLKADECLIPAHPLQAESLMLEGELQSLLRTGKLRYLGRAGDKFSATSSVRTLYSPNCPWMLKFSIPVRLTNSLRVTKRNELGVGMLMARLLDALHLNQPEARFQIITDPAYLTLDIPGRDESGFELILRNNPFPHGCERNVFTIAALTADPMPKAVSLLARTVIEAAKARHVTVLDMAKTWFSDYLDCCFDPMLELYDKHGIALEAHQQNALVRLRDGVPRVGYFRDSQGYLITRDALPKLVHLVPELSDLAVLAYDTTHINSRLAYYLVVNQVFAVIRRMGRDGLVPEQDLLRQLVQHLKHHRTSLSGPAAEFIDTLLTTPNLLTKANLLTRVQDIDELEEAEQEGLFVNMQNPIAATAKALGTTLDIPAQEPVNVLL